MEFTGWGSDDEEFEGGLSLEELAAQNAAETIALFLDAEARLYGEIDQGTSPMTTAEDACEPHRGFDMGGYGAPASPPVPCHVEWESFTNMRVRGRACRLVPRPADIHSSSLSADVDVDTGAEEVLAEHWDSAEAGSRSSTEPSMSSVSTQVDTERSAPEKHVSNSAAQESSARRADDWVRRALDPKATPPSSPRAAARQSKLRAAVAFVWDEFLEDAKLGK